jgi:hypothetical protein
MERKLRSSGNDMNVNAPLGHASRARDNPVILPTQHTLIHRLPPEIMIMVFCGVAKPLQWKSLTQLSSVCRRWRDIVNGTKYLWHEITIFRKDVSNRLFQQAYSHPNKCA